MSTQSQALRQAMATATTGAELNALALALAADDRARGARKQVEADLDWAATVVAATFTPVAVHTVHTAASDWLGDIPEGSPDSGRLLVAEASLWYTRLHPDVLADDGEFAAQAHTAATRAAGRLRMHPAAAAPQFLDYVHFLRKRAGSGLPQIDQTIDANNMPSATGYPADVFDNFAPEVDPVNAGVSGTETSARAPIMQELMSGGRPASAPGSATMGGPVEDGDDQDPDGDQDEEADEDKGALNPNLAARRTAAMPEYGDEDFDMFGADPDDERDRHLEEMRRRADPMSAGRAERIRRQREDYNHEYQMLRHLDDAREYGEDYASRAHPMPYPHTGASTLDQIQQTTAPDGVTQRPTPLPEAVAYPWIISPDAENPAPPADGEMAQTMGDPTTGEAAYGRQARHVIADQWHGQEWPHAAVQPDAANNPGTTPVPPTGTAEAGRAAATADAAADDTAPTYADASSGAPEYARAYAQTYSTTPAPPRGRDVPPGQSGPPTRPARLSWLLSRPEERAHPDYAAGYLAGTTWKAAGTIPAFGNDAYEAGLYAGILDNPTAQEHFTAAHHSAADHQHLPGARARIARHGAASAHFLHRRPAELAAFGPYLRAQGATSTDLDTMAPGTSADPSGSTPFNGPGTPPMLQGQYGAADPGGPAPYNGAPPYGAPAVPTSATAPADPAAALVPETGMTTPNRATAFRRTVQANLARTAAGAPLLTLTDKEAR